MSKDIMQDKLKQLRDAVKQRWGALTDKDLDTIDKKLDQLPGLLQARYGYTREQAEKEIDLFLSGMKPEGEKHERRNTMPLIHLVLVLVVVGVILWVINSYIPMQSTIKKLLNVVVVICVIIWLLTVFGLIGNLSTIRIG